jgi:predicted transcriptional regulator
MPKYVRPANAEHAEDPIKTFGNMVRAGIIGHLRQHPGQTRAEIARALELNNQTASVALSGLVEVGLVSADPPRETAARGQWIRYRVEDAAVSELYLQLGQAIGEI